MFQYVCIEFVVFILGTNAATERTDEMCAKSSGEEKEIDNENTDETGDDKNDDDDVETVDENNQNNRDGLFY